MREVWKTRIELDEKRERQRERVLKHVGERKKRETERREKKQRWKREKRGVLRETGGTRTLFWGKRDHFLFP